MANIIQAVRNERKLRFPRQFWGVQSWPWLFLWVLMLALPARQTLGVGLTAQVDRQVVPVGETFNLSLVFDGVSPGGAPNLPNLPNLQQTGVSQASSFSFANGATESKITYTYSLVPTQPGDITIPAMQVNTGGKVLTTQPIMVKIVQGTPPPNPEATLSNL